MVQLAVMRAWGRQGGRYWDQDKMGVDGGQDREVMHHDDKCLDFELGLILGQLLEGVSRVYLLSQVTSQKLIWTFV